MNTKKLLIIYIILTLCIPILSFTVSADPDVGFFLQPDTGTVAVGEQFNITVYIDATEELISTLAVNNLTFTTDYVNVSLEYETNISYWLNSGGFFDYTQDLVRLDGNLSESGGWISNAIWSVNEENASTGTGYMFNITFNATAPGTCYINLTDIGASYGVTPNLTSFGSNSTITVSSGDVSPPSPFTASTEGRTAINSTWSHGVNSTYSHIENNTFSSWEYGTGTLVYNGTGTAKSHTSLEQGTTMYYQAWGWNDTSQTLSTTNSSSSATTDWNLPILYYGENPVNGSTVNLTFDFNNTFVDPDNTMQIDYTYEASNSETGNGFNLANGSYDFSNVGPFGYDTQLSIWVNASDEFSPDNRTYARFDYTTRTEYQPDAPGIVAVGYNTTQINLSWTDDDEADTTLVEWSASSDGTWEPNSGEHTELYNGTAELTTQGGLSPGTHRYYKAWSWNNTDLVWSTGSTDDTSTLGQAPLLAGENPSNTSTNIPLNTTPTLNVTVYNSYFGDLNWTIQSAIGSSSSNGEDNGSKTCSISGLQNNTTYTWYVNATELGNDVNASYWFTTTEHPFQPNTPNPSNNSNGNSISSILLWSGGDPDGDDVNYTVFFGDSSPPPLVSSNQSGLTYNPGSLNYSDDYYWRVISYDDKGGNITGPIWDFSTADEGPPPEDVGNITINETVGIGVTNATLTGFVFNHSDPDATVPCGFVCGPITRDSITNYTFNISNGDVANMSSYHDEATGLTSAEYYYGRAWMQLDEGFNISGEGYFLTKPNPPTNLDASLSGVDMYVTWDIASVGDGTNLTTIIRYSNSTQPATMFEGEDGYNGTSDHCLITGLDTNRLYNFSAFSFINSSGSPTLFQVSDTYSSVNATSFSGGYNISIRWENTTHELVNTTLGVYHRFIVHYTDRTEVNLFNATGYIPSQETNGNWTLATSGEWNISCPEEPLFFEFCWNDTHENPYVTEGDLASKSEYATVFDYSINTTNNLTYTPEEIVSVYIYNSTPSYPRWVEIPEDMYTLTVNQVEINASAMDLNSTMSRVDYYYRDPDTYVATDYRCNRKIVPIAGQENITFYILTDKPVYGESSSYMNHSIVKYTYSFLDETAYYRPPNDPIAEFYIYDVDGNKLMIHSEYFDSSLRVRPWLYYGKNYFVGVRCNIDSIARIGIAPTGDDTASDIRIPYDFDRQYSFFDLIDLAIGWDATGMYVHYTDTTDSTTSATFYVYNYTSGALLHSENTGLSSYNFTYVCNTSIPYKCNIIATLDDINDLYDGTYQVGGGACWIMLPDETWINTNVSNINTILTTLFGKSPLFDLDYPEEADVEGNYQHTVAWTYIALFSIAFILFVSFGKLNGFVGTMAAGLFILASGAFIEGLMSTIVGAGMFILIVGIIGLIGGVDKR